MAFINLLLANLPALVIAIPLFAAPIIALLPTTENGRWAAWLFSFLVAGLVFAGCFHLFVKVMEDGAHGYSMGNWPPPMGIQYMAGKLNSFILLVLSAVNFLIVPFAYTSVESEVERNRIPLFYSAYLLCLSGLFGMVISNDIFNIYVFLEISSIAAYAMIAQGKNGEALKATFNYLIIGTVGATFFLMGIAFLYAETGSLNISDITNIIAAKPFAKTTLAALLFMATGLIVKAGIFPFSYWVAPVYSSAPSFVSSFLAATATKISLFVLFRLIYEIFGADIVLHKMHLSPVLSALAISGMVYSSYQALRQNDVKRILAYSSIANISYILLALSLGSVTALVAALFHYLAHSVAKGGMFVATGIVTMHSNGSLLKNFHGMAKQLPLTMAGMVFLGFSLIGLPLTVGFVTKWYLLTAVFETGNLGLKIFATTGIIASTVLSAAYIWKIVEAIYLNNDVAAKPPRLFSPMPVALLAAACLGFGAYSPPVINFLREIATEVLANV